MIKLKAVRVVTFNIRHGRGTDNQVNIKRVADTLDCAGGQLIGLQEVDRYMPRSGFCHQPAWLAERLFQNWAFGANLKWMPRMQYGNAVLSRWPIVSRENHLLPGRGEQRGLLETQILVEGMRVAFYSVHLGLNREERLQQAQRVLEVVSACRGPVIRAPAFNDSRQSPEYSLITGVLRDATAAGGEIKTFPADNPVKQLDFIFISDHWQAVSACPVFSGASDHLAVAADIAFTHP